MPKSINRRDALSLGAAGAVTLAFHDTAQDAFGAPPALPVSNTPGLGERKAVVLTDLSQCQPQNALADRLTPGTWKKVPYEAGPYKGVLLWSPTGNDPAPVTVALGATGSLGATGWYRVYVGIASLPAVGLSVTLFRFTKEPAFIARNGSKSGIEEVPLGAWDLTGQDLEIAARTGGARPFSGLAYVRLEPISEEEGKRQSAMGRGITASNDGFSYFHDRDPQTAQELWEDVWYFRQSDVDQLILQCGSADTTNYPSKIGTMMGLGQELFPRPGDGNIAHTCAKMAKKGINPTTEMIKAAHALGIETLIGYRPAAWEFVEPLHDFMTSPYYQKHTEWRTYDRDGTLVPRLSYAIPEVRKYAVEVLRESVSFGADGVSVMFNRGTPLVLFEKQFCDPFTAKYGVDPHDLPDDEPRVLAERAGYIGAFMKELRAMLDEEGAQRGDGKRLKLAAIGLADEETNLYYGIDLRAWAAAGLLDSLIAWNGQHIPGKTTPQDIDLTFYRDICAAKRIPFRPSIIGWRMDRDPKKNAEKFLEQYAAGADGFLYWDANSIQDQQVWQPLSRFGSRERTEAFVQSTPPPKVVYSIRKEADVSLHGRFGPDQGF